MISLIVHYIFYNIISGFLFYSFYYLFSEKKNKNKSIFVKLIFFPAYGLGNWKWFKNEKLSDESIAFPKKWFLAKYITRFHLGFLIFLFISWFVYGESQVIEAYKNNRSQPSEYIDYASQIIENSAAVVFSFFEYLFIIISYVVISLLMLLIPYLNKNAIEKKVYRKHN